MNNINKYRFFSVGNSADKVNSATNVEIDYYLYIFLIRLSVEVIPCLNLRMAIGLKREEVLIRLNSKYLKDRFWVRRCF